MKAIHKIFKDYKLRHKLMGIYICIGTIPILLIGIFAYYQQRATLIGRETQNISDALSQGVSRFDSQVLVYENMSDYIAFNSSISNALLTEYSSNYEMYEQYTNYVDPALSSLKYFNPNICQLTIYVDREIVPHDTTVASLDMLDGQEWYEQGGLTQAAEWKVDADAKKVFCVRKMPIMEQAGVTGILYVEVDYADLFASFDKIFQDDYGLFVYNGRNQAVYQSGHFADGNEEWELSETQLLQEQKKQDKGKAVSYSIVEKEIAMEGCRVLIYRPEKMLADAADNLLYLVVALIMVCVVVSLAAEFAFSRLVVRDIEALQKNMKSVGEGDMTLRVTSDARDEIGDLIRGFGSMLVKINHLINEVYEEKLLQKKYEMRALQAQINPHFLYNSLSLINWKALEAGKEDISKLTLALSSFYRTSLNRGNNILTIERELENMKSYLEIQSCMHDDSFDVLLDIDEQIYPYETLNLILQPLVENSIEHGIDLLEERKGYIKIIGRMDENNIYLIVEDNGVGIEPDILESLLEFKTRGYGVRNVNERITLYYGEEYRIQIESELGKGTKSVITIPKRQTVAQ